MKLEKLKLDDAFIQLGTERGWMSNSRIRENKHTHET